MQEGIRPGRKISSQLHQSCDCVSAPISRGKMKHITLHPKIIHCNIRLGHDQQLDVRWTAMLWYMEPRVAAGSTSTLGLPLSVQVYGLTASLGRATDAINFVKNIDFV